MNTSYAAIAELSNISFFYNDLRNPFPIPQAAVRKICGFEEPKKVFYGRIDASSEAYNKNKPLILEVLKDINTYMTALDISLATKLYVSSVRRDLRQLKEMGLVVSTRSHTEGFKKGTMLWKFKGKEE